MSETIKRPRNYSKISITRDEAERFLDSQVWLRVASFDSENQNIWNLPTHYVRIGNDLYFDESPDSLLVRNYEKNSSCCAVADTGYSYDDLVGAIVQGSAEFVTNKDTIQKISSLIAEKYKLLTGRPPVQNFEERTFIRIKPTREGLDAITWNFGKGHL